MQSGIYEGMVRHRRFEPIRHEFRVSLFMIYLDLAELPDVFRGRWLWSVERSNVAVFRRSDHVGDIQVSLDETIRSLVETQTGSRPNGPIRLLTNLSYFGYCFNPLSVYFCYDETGERLHSVVAEVTNTPWGERHCYVLPAIAVPEGAMKQTFTFPKQFHVSPFMNMNLEYCWKLSGPGKSLVLHAENRRNDQAFFDATLTLDRRPITTWTLTRMLVRYPLMTFQVITNIYWQALCLWWMNVSYVPHPKNLPKNSSR